MYICNGNFTGFLASAVIIFNSDSAVWYGPKL